MPYGMSMPRFISLVTLSMLAMFSGSQVVHMVFKPLDDLDDLIEQELKATLSRMNNVEKD